MAPPEGDGLELGHHQRHQAVGQGGVDEMLVGGHALHVGGPSLSIHLDHPVEGRHVEAGAGSSGAGPEQIGRLLGQPHRLPGRNGAIRGLQLLHPVAVGGPGGVGIRRQVAVGRPRSCREATSPPACCRLTRAVRPGVVTLAASFRTWAFLPLVNIGDPAQHRQHDPRWHETRPRRAAHRRPPPAGLRWASLASPDPVRTPLPPPAGTRRPPPDGPRDAGRARATQAPGGPVRPGPGALGLTPSRPWLPPRPIDGWSPPPARAATGCRPRCQSWHRRGATPRGGPHPLPGRRRARPGAGRCSGPSRAPARGWR